MRCKNCGFENDDNLYICQNCGSPLYDEDEPLNSNEEQTMLFNPVTMGETQQPGQPLRSNEERLQREREEEKKKKQQIIIIAVLSAILAIIVIAIIVAFATKGRNNENTSTLPLITVSENSEDVTDDETTEPTTRETTTATTTETTTEPATTTTAPKTFKINTTANDGGETEGDGSYKLGESAVLIARADDGYKFDGWYVNSEKVSSSEVFNLVVTGDTTVQAVFVPIPTEAPETPEVTDNTDGSGDIDNIEDQD